MGRLKPMTHTVMLSPFNEADRRVSCRLTKRLIIVREYGLKMGGPTFNRETGRESGGGFICSHVHVESLQSLEEKIVKPERKIYRFTYEEEEEHLDHVEIVRDLGDLAWEGRGSYAGWLTPDATFIGVGPWKHDQYARRVLCYTPKELQKRGWVKVTHESQANLLPGMQLTEAQAEYLLAKMEQRGL